MVPIWMPFCCSPGNATTLIFKIQDHDQWRTMYLLRKLLYLLWNGNRRSGLCPKRRKHCTFQLCRLWNLFCSMSQGSIKTGKWFYGWQDQSKWNITWEWCEFDGLVEQKITRIKFQKQIQGSGFKVQNLKLWILNLEFWIFFNFSLFWNWSWSYEIHPDRADQSDKG